ncbi:ATP-binding protein [Streptomyces aureocirculatus]|uniref:ATP-binding protein n=1 Tax=Streptomyces aureocirculatus TaxID=67275 RepID=UPI000B2CF7BA|nr:ATP-binding protein [Streptomyces aureocirculatus]
MNSEITRTVRSARTERRFCAQLPSTWRGARRARLLAAEQLRAWAQPHEDAEHIVAELAANAAVYGRVPARDFRLTLTRRADGVLRIEVADTRSDRLPVVREPDEEAESGRGLVIVAALADRWGVELGPDPLKTVWAELDGKG